MIEVETFWNGSYPADELPVDIVDSISSAHLAVLTEDIRVWDGRRTNIVSKGQYFVIDEGVAYPFDLPLYQASIELETEEQMLPETWDDVIAIIESFGR